MNWEVLQDKLQSIAKRLKQNKLLDAAAKAALEEIPFVGKFLAKYADSLGQDAGSALNMATFLDAIAQQRESFENIQKLIQEQGDSLLKQDVNVSEILLRASETGDRLKAVQAQINLLVATFRNPSAKAAFENAAAMDEDRRQKLDLIAQTEAALKNAGAHADADDFYGLGMLYLSTSEFDRAEASLLAALHIQPDMTAALQGLAMTFQLLATEHLRSENFGLAEAAALKSKAYTESALQQDPTNISLQLHLGYLYKDLAQCYRGGRNETKARAAEDQAWRCFDVVVKVNPEDPSGHNGLGDISLLRADYDAAIAHCSKAIELAPNYLFAYYDLALAYYYKADKTQEQRPRLEAMKAGIETYIKLLDLDGTPEAGNLPPMAREQIEALYQPLIANITQSAKTANPANAN